MMLDHRRHSSSSPALFAYSHPIATLKVYFSPDSSRSPNKCVVRVEVRDLQLAKQVACRMVGREASRPRYPLTDF